MSKKKTGLHRLMAILEELEELQPEISKARASGEITPEMFTPEMMAVAQKALDTLLELRARLHPKPHLVRKTS